MKAYRYNLEKYSENKTDVFDNRKHFSEAIFSYYTDSGTEYRRKFQLSINTPESEFFKIAPLEINVKE
jgi:hypothetical protein